MDRKFLKELLETPSVSGHEEKIQKKALAFGKQFAGKQLTETAFPLEIGRASCRERV